MEKNVPINIINKEYGKHACYVAELLIDNNLYVPNKPFFPAHWTQEKVISKIQEAYGDFKRKNINLPFNHRGNYIIRGFIREGIEIEMVLTMDNTIRSAYPILD